MSTAIIVIALVMIGIYSVKSYMKKLKSGCCGGITDTIQKIKPQDSHINHYPFQKHILIEGMTCDNCKIRIENAFHTQGIFLMKINRSKGTSELYCKEYVSNESIKRTIQDLGYHVSKIEEVTV